MADMAEGDKYEGKVESGVAGVGWGNSGRRGWQLYQPVCTVDTKIYLISEKLNRLDALE
jgi:hypothetical protein